MRANAAIKYYAYSPYNDVATTTIMTQSGDNSSTYLVLTVTIETMGAHVMQNTVSPFSANGFCLSVGVGIVGSIGIAFALSFAFALAVVFAFSFALVFSFALLLVLAICFCVRSFFYLRISNFFHLTLHFVGIAYAADNLLHGVDVDSCHAVLLQTP